MSPGPGEAESRHDAFERGQRSGKTDARLDGAEDRLHKINGSISELIAEVRIVATNVQRLADRFEASEKTVIATAEALEKADVARRAKVDQGWSPLARWATAITLVSALLGAVFLLINR